MVLSKSRKKHSLDLVDLRGRKKKNKTPRLQSLLTFKRSHHLVKKSLDVFTNSYCSRWNKKSPDKSQIIKYIRDYDINWKSADRCRRSPSIEDCASHYDSMNDFFQRHVRDLPKVHINDSRLKSPADCRLVAYDTIENATHFWIKGSQFTIPSLLTTNTNENYSIFVCRLAPDDYHRFHVPVSCSVISKKTVHGSFYSVNPSVVNSKNNVFTENKRVVCKLSTQYFGDMYMVIIGAACVGSIELSSKSSFIQGEEFGTFGFGGSTIVLLIQQDMIRISNNILKNSMDNTETYVRVGNTIGRAT